jgi:hypothetical protein
VAVLWHTENEMDSQTRTRSNSDAAILAIFAAGLLAVVAIVIAFKAGSPSVAIPEVMPTVTAQQLDDAIAIAHSSPDIPAQIRQHEWDVYQEWPVGIAGANHAVQFNAHWDEPVSSDGPWTRLACMGTIIYENDTLWHDVTAARITVDLDHDRVVGLIVQDPPNYRKGDTRPYPYEDAAGKDDTVRVYSARTGMLLPFNGYNCPAGTEYD